MSESNLEIEMENVGVFKGKKKFILKKGLNEVKAPNAKGKTSFTHGLELLIIPNSELKGKGYYMNLFANAPNDKVEINVKSNDINWIRRIRRPTNSNNLIPASDEIFPLSNINIANLCIAIPENELMNSILHGKSIKGYIEEISGSKSYTTILKSLEKKNRDFERQHQIYQDDLIRLEETRNSLKTDLNDKVKYEEELEKIPEIDKEELLKNTEVRSQYTEKESEKKMIDKNITTKKGKLESLDQTIQDLKRNIERKKQFIADIELEYPKIKQKIEESKLFKKEKDDELTEVQKELSKYDDYLNSINDSWTRMNKYGEEKCSACGRPFSLKDLQEYEKECEKTKNDYMKQKKTLSRTIEDYEDEIDELQKQERQLSIEEGNLAKLEKTLANRELEYDKLKKSLDEDLKEQRKIEKEIKQLLQNVSEDLIEIKEKRDRLIERINILESKIDETNKRIKDLGIRTKGADIIKNKINFLDKAINYLKIKRDEIINKAAFKFNERIKEIIKKLEFTDFKDIVIKDDYKIYITREKDGIIMSDWALEALSTSERYTLGITFLIAAKEEYLPDFPFFVIDEIITSYDEDRMQKIKEYVADITDYVIITLLEPESSSDKLIVEHIS